MRFLLAAIVVLSAGLGACSGSAPSATRKLDSPTVDLLSARQLEDVATECLKYPSFDDQRVPYTEGYCSLALKERNTRSLQVSKPEQDRNRSLLMMGKDNSKPAAGNSP